MTLTALSPQDFLTVDQMIQRYRAPGGAFFLRIMLGAVPAVQLEQERQRLLQQARSPEGQAQVAAVLHQIQEMRQTPEGRQRLNDLRREIQSPEGTDLLNQFQRILIYPGLWAPIQQMIRAVNTNVQPTQARSLQGRVAPQAPEVQPLAPQEPAPVVVLTQADLLTRIWAVVTRILIDIWQAIYSWSCCSWFLPQPPNLPLSQVLISTEPL